MATEVIKVRQDALSEECWLIQFKGLRACNTCELKGKKDCGGKNIRKTLLNNKGIAITESEGVK